MNNLEKLNQDAVEIMVKYNDYRDSASTNKTAYETCEALMKELHNLDRFAKRYCGYEIEIMTTHDGNQYTPERIWGVSIKEVKADADN